MNKLELHDAVGRLAIQPGLLGCALVEPDTGMVWSSHGELSSEEALWEASVNAWRMTMRHRELFMPLGELGAAVMYHTQAVLATFQVCTDPPLVFVAAGRHREVDWVQLQRLAREVGNLVARHVN